MRGVFILLMPEERRSCDRMMEEAKAWLGKKKKKKRKSPWSAGKLAGAVWPAEKPSKCNPLSDGWCPPFQKTRKLQGRIWRRLPEKWGEPCCLFLCACIILVPVTFKTAKRRLRIWIQGHPFQKKSVKIPQNPYRFQDQPQNRIRSFLVQGPSKNYHDQVITFWDIGEKV